MRFRWGMIHISGRLADYSSGKVSFTIKYVLCKQASFANQMVYSNHGASLSASWFNQVHEPLIRKRSLSVDNKSYCFFSVTLSKFNDGLLYASIHIV